MSVPLPYRICFALVCLLGCVAFAAAADRTAEARELINAMGCKGCHAFNGKGGTLGPDLEKVGRRLGREELLRDLIEPRADNPASAMPSYDHLTEEQLDLLISYMLNLR